MPRPLSAPGHRRRNLKLAVLNARSHGTGDLGQMNTGTQTTQPDARAEALVAAYERAGYLRLAPPLLHPAEPFLDLSGEDIRKRMYLTTDAAGRELCLRPDLTIPVSCEYLASPEAGSPQGFCYLGPVFRDRGAL